MKSMPWIWRFHPDSHPEVSSLFQERYEKRGERNTQTNLFYAQVIKRLIYSINVSIDKADLSHLYYTLSHAGDD